MPSPTLATYIDKTNIALRGWATDTPVNNAYSLQNGPYQNGSNFYMVCIAGNITHAPLRVYKSTDQGNTWTAMDTGHSPFVVFNQCSVCQQVGSTLVIMYANFNSSNVFTGYQINTFDMSTDLWGTATADLVPSGADGHNTKFTFLASAVGTYVVLVGTHVSPFPKLWYGQYSGGVWGSLTQLTDVNFAAGICLAGFARDTGSNVLHFLYQQYQTAGGSPLASNLIRYANLNISAALSSATTAMTASQAFQSAPFYNSYPGFGEGSVSSGGNLIFPFAEGGIITGEFYPATLTFNGSVWSTNTISTDEPNDSTFTGLTNYIQSVKSGTTVYVFWCANFTDLAGHVQSKIRYTTTSDGITFSAPITHMNFNNVLPTPPPTFTNPSLTAIVNPSVSILPGNIIATAFECTADDFNQYTFVFFSSVVVPVNFTYDVGILTNIFDNNTPRQRKDSFTMRGRFKGTSCNFNVITDLTGEVLIATFSSANWIDFTFDLNALLDVAFNGHPTWYQVHITGTTSVFFLADLEIFFDERPVPLTFKRSYNDNYNSTTPKRMRSWPFMIDTRGGDVTFTPYVDNVALTPVTFNTNERTSVQYNAITDIFGTDYGYTFGWSGVPGVGQGYELWEDQGPVFVETLPNGFLFWQCGPAHLFRYGRMLSFELRTFVAAGLTSIPYTVYFDDNTRQSGTISVIPLKQNTYLVQGLKGEAGAVTRIEFGPTSAIFYPYYVRGKFQLSGSDTDGQWVNIVENG